MRQIWTAMAAALLIALGLAGSPAVNAGSDSGRPRQCPSVVIWAWERPENLQFVDPEKAGIAFLWRVVRLSGNGIQVRPRTQSIKLPAHAWLTAVVRVETDRKAKATLSASQLEAASLAIAEAARLSGVRAVQIDFDARSNERAFYKELITSVRRQIPASTELSMTALASWCVGDYWIDKLPVDEIVPMLFRMGQDRQPVLSALQSGGAPPSRCRACLGIATDEPSVAAALAQPSSAWGSGHRKVYVFSPRPWRRGDVELALKSLRRWQ